jgi:hypothetical protein
VLDFILSNPLLRDLWFVYVTFHDIVQWVIMAIVGMTVYGQRRHKKELRELAVELERELSHVHAELHNHILQDASLHKDLGQGGMTLGE